jgi:hypothetical protein
MKVKISYTIDDSEIPNEIAKFLNKVENELTHKAEKVRETSENIKNNFDADRLENYWREINTIRQEMIKADTIMSDCQEILIGLNSILEQQRQEATAAEDNQIVILPEPAVNTGDGDSID